MTDDTRVLLYSLTHGGYCVSIAGSIYAQEVRSARWCARDFASAMVEDHPEDRLVIADLDGWIQHGGGECPVTGWTPVEVRFADGTEHDNRTADGWSWIPSDLQREHRVNITAWRPAQEEG